MPSRKAGPEKTELTPPTLAYGSWFASPYRRASGKLIFFGILHGTFSPPLPLPSPPPPLPPSSPPAKPARQSHCPFRFFSSSASRSL